MTSQQNKSPKSAEPRRKTYAEEGAHLPMMRASEMPKEDSISAGKGDPEPVSLPNTDGAYPSRAKEKRIRESAYKLAFAPDKAAERKTKFIMCDTAGNFAARKTETKGLSATPAPFHGITPTSTTIAPS